MRNIKVIALLGLVLCLQGCIGLAGVAILGVGAVATKTAIDPRTTGRQIDDTSLDSKVSIALNENSELSEKSRVIVTSYKGMVLLTGQAPNKKLVEEAQRIAFSIPEVNRVYNQIRIGNPVSASTISRDSWLTTKIRAEFLGNEQIKGRNLKVVTENGEAFLFGIVTKDEGARAAQLVSHINGIRSVNTIFVYVDE